MAPYLIVEKKKTNAFSVGHRYTNKHPLPSASLPSSQNPTPSHPFPSDSARVTAGDSPPREAPNPSGPGAQRTVCNESLRPRVLEQFTSTIRRLVVRWSCVKRPSVTARWTLSRPALGDPGALHQRPVLVIRVVAAVPTGGRVAGPDVSHRAAARGR